MSPPKVFPLHCVVQHYDWGKHGSNSEVAQLIKCVCPSFRVDEDKPYAELWMGTHPSGPSSTMTPEKKIGKPLSEVLEDNPEFLGDKIRKKFGDKLPYLLKVLSVNTALSIQAHPNKTRAEQLHKERPDIYKDPNHKPEMAVALTPFEALCGFRPFGDIVKFLKGIPELESLVGTQIVNSMDQSEHLDDTARQKELLKECFTTVMTSSKDTIKSLLTSLVERITNINKNGQDTNSFLGELLLRVYKDFPGDVGCFGIYFLNYLKMQPGEALFLGPDEAHAYLFGDCVEIMACSDNVVRAGLTPKFIDVAELCEMLTYVCMPAEGKLFKGEKLPDSYCTIYSPPVPDFALDKVEIPATVKSYTFESKEGASILLVVRGRAQFDCGQFGIQHLKRGSVIFIAANQSLHITMSDTSEEDLLIFQAYCRL